MRKVDRTQRIIRTQGYEKIGFLSFGHWTPSPQSGTRSAADTLLQSIDLAVAAEELGQTARISACTTSPDSLARRSLCWPL